ncbi:proteasome subunit beta type-6 [Pyrus ussuriensis x Pyrus communis]|uniref:Proteasome subunit beta type-6 n=1 Tax=Pyrus ussuriensis x Pyrus communis TaxID=2448454 RepID=A0A5N5GUB3_9ROSA|nr:proteasome subunit beta type-6 [Pyrus ussuriensis x Pyrus communis]
MEPEASELPKGLVLGRDGNIHLRITPLGDVGSCLLIRNWNENKESNFHYGLYMCLLKLGGIKSAYIQRGFGHIHLWIPNFLGNLRLKVCANLVRLLSYGKKDKHEGGKIYGIPLGGTLLELPFAIGGMIWLQFLVWIFRSAWKEGMTKDEAEQLVVKAVSLAIARDGASGGVVRTVVTNFDGVTRNYYPGDKLPLWHEELEPQNSLLDILNSSSPEPMNTQ